MNKKITFAVIISILFFSFYLWVDARAGWGWGSGNNEGWIVTAVIGSLYLAIYKIRRMKMIKKAKKDLENALKQDSSWDIEWLKRHVSDTFYQYQNDWQNKSRLNMRWYMTKNYHSKVTELLHYQLKDKKNVLDHIRINSLTLMSVRDNPGKDGDMFAMEIDASMIDYTIWENTWEFISSTLKREKHEPLEKYKHRAMTESAEFKEYYIFIRHNGKWLLSNVKQKFSIIWDIIWLSEKKLKNILQQEKNSEFTSDDILYTD